MSLVPIVGVFVLGFLSAAVLAHRYSLYGIRAYSLFAAVAVVLALISFVVWANCGIEGFFGGCATSIP